MKYVKIRTEENGNVRYGLFNMSDPAHYKAVFNNIERGATVTLTAYVPLEEDTYDDDTSDN